MKDFTNFKKGKLTALSFDKRLNNKTYWNFKCDCGSIKSFRIDDIIYSTKSHCGCEKIKTKIPFKSSFNAYLRMYKKSAKKRNYNFNLTNDFFYFLILDNCHYCGVEPSKNYLNNGYFFNGIDRIENKKGYEINNVVTCCETCNKAKRDLSYNDFIKWINKLINNQKSKKLC